MGLVVPAVLPSSREELEEKLALFADIPEITRVQIDVVDGEFAAPASWPYTAPGALSGMVRSGSMLPRLDRTAYEIDLMCTDAERAAEEWLTLGATRLTFHAESTSDLTRLLSSVRRRYGPEADFAPGLISFGLAANVETDLSVIEACLSEIDYVQFMGIARIGVQGQPFDERTLAKIRIFRERHPEVALQVDGGVTLDVAKRLVSLGITNLVVGSAILRAKNPAAIIQAFNSLPTPYGV